MIKLIGLLQSSNDGYIMVDKPVFDAILVQYKGEFMYIPLEAFNEYRAWPRAAYLRQIIWKINKKTNIYPSFAKKLGRRILINPEAFDLWIKSDESKIMDGLFKKDRKTVTE